MNVIEGEKNLKRRRKYKLHEKKKKKEVDRKIGINEERENNFEKKYV